LGRAKRDGRIENRTPRLRLPHRKEPYWTVLEPGQALGYYRSRVGSAGQWFARLFDLETKVRKQSALGSADDFSEADGQEVLNFSQAQAKAREWFRTTRALASGEAVRKGPYTVANALEDYFRDCERRGVRGLRQMTLAANAHILPALGSIEAGRLSQSRLERWHEQLSLQAARVRSKRSATEPSKRELPKTDDEHRRRRATANRILTILKAALNHALTKRRVACNGEAWREAKPFRGATEARTRFLSVEDQTRLVNGCAPGFKELTQAALFTGARYGELTRLEVRDFNAEARTLFIEVGKGGKSRHVILTEEAARFFREVTTGRSASERIFLRESYPTRNWQTTEEKILRPWSHAEQFREMKAACAKAGLDYLNFHQLRHTYASTLVNAGMPLVYVAEQLGHTDTRMVEKHYGHLAPNALADAIRKLTPKLGIHQPSNVVPLRMALESS
jgi:integrase